MHTAKMNTQVARRRLPDSVTLVRLLGLLASLVANGMLLSWLLLSGPNLVPNYPMPVAGIAQWIAAIAGPARKGGPQSVFAVFMVLNILGALVFAASFWIRTSPSMKRSPSADLVLLGAQIGVSLGCNIDLLVVVAVALPFIFSTRAAAGWGCGMVLALVAVKLPQILHAGSIEIVCNIPDIKLPSLAINTAMEIGWGIAWQAFAFCAGYVAMAEQRSRIELAMTHAELAAAQQFLADAVRSSERVRIARDLHDSIGHQLTALNLHLDLAVRQAGVALVVSLSQSLSHARELAQRLLAEVRTVVSSERRDAQEQPVPTSPPSPRK